MLLKGTINVVIRDVCACCGCGCDGFLCVCWQLCVALQVALWCLSLVLCGSGLLSVRI